MSELRAIDVGGKTVGDGLDTTLVTRAGLAAEMLSAGDPATPVSLDSEPDVGVWVLGCGV
jgi:hypothetical protein